MEITVEQAKEVIRNSKDTIGIFWSTEDVLYQAKEDEVDLTKEEAREILETIEHMHDACEGINWMVISAHISMYKD